MPDHGFDSLDRVAEQVDQIVDETLDILDTRIRNPDQQVLSVTQKQALSRLRRVFRDSRASAENGSESILNLASAILSTAAAFIVDTMSDSVPYKQRREHSRIARSIIYDCSRLY